MHHKNDDRWIIRAGENEAAQEVGEKYSSSIGRGKASEVNVVTMREKDEKRGKLEHSRAR